jgi:hypothetical protein
MPTKCILAENDSWDPYVILFPILFAIDELDKLVTSRLGGANVGEVCNVT